jgi:hypothetical protein
MNALRETRMHPRLNSACAVLCSGVAVFLGSISAGAQEDLQRVSLKSGESTELRNYSFIVANCQSIMVGTPSLDVLEGPEELSFTLKEGKVMRKDRSCTTPVPGGQVVATAREVKQAKEARLTIRLNYMTKDGPRQSASAYLVSLSP